MKKNVLAIDIGNTKISIGIVDTNKLTCLISKNFLVTTDIEKVISFICTLSIRYSLIEMPCIISSVGSISTYQMAASIKKKLQIKNIVLFSNQATILDIAYQTTNSLGTDRCAAALYAAYLNPNHTTIIIDAGTAITVDLLENGTRYRGGYILPGIAMQQNSLFTETTMLLESKSTLHNTDIPPSSTISSIHEGVMISVAGGISAAVLKLKQRYNVNTIIATGGGWNTIKHLCDFEHMYIPDMTLIGIALYNSIN